ncbi:hypothetical protein ACFYPC_25320 [Streptomyces sp. NPDC005808]|uniref:hypothetical protein n=1 Tax=Streptomyces sp. NPDC005808 TaxID=3364734 RepID=UPI00368E9681
MIRRIRIERHIGPARTGRRPVSRQQRRSPHGDYERHERYGNRLLGIYDAYRGHNLSGDALCEFGEQRRPYEARRPPPGAPWTA